jgi:transglutaminase-like putative cysteine protease
MTDHLIRSVQLLLAVMMVLGAAPILDEIDWRIGGLLLVILAWRAAVSTGRVTPIKLWQKVAIVAVALGAIRLVFDSLWSLDSLVSLILVLWTAKFLEMQRTRDAYVLILLNFFVVFCHLLYSQTLTTVILAMASSIYGLLMLVRLHVRVWRDVWLAIRMLLPASLVMATLMFVLLPAAGALWKIPLQRDSAVTGLSDRVSPGDIAELVKSNETAFRVESDRGEWPLPRDRYWRAIVLDWFDGESWRESRWQEQIGSGANCVPTGNQYQIMVEPHFQPWLFTLDGYVTDDVNVRNLANQTVRAPLPLAQRVSYSICASETPSQPERIDRERYLHLGDSNPRARAWGESLRELETPEAKAQVVLQHYFDNSVYTLRPGTADSDALDAFLFDEPRGFCEHFASSFAFVMRAAGVPSRVVVGYQGGELSPVADYLRVAQSDAHAWTEIWVDGTGWQRVDPTAYVAPQRIEAGFAQDDNSTWLAGEPWYEFSHSPTWRAWVLRFDAVNYAFATWVASFDNTRREGWMTRWLGGSEWWRSVAVIMATSLALTFLGLGWQRYRQRPKYSAAIKQYLKTERSVRRRFRARLSGETPRRFLTNASVALGTDDQVIARLRRATEQLEQHEYQASSEPI